MMRFFNGSNRDREENTRLLGINRPLAGCAAQQQFGDQRMLMNLGQIQGLQPGGESLPAQLPCRLQTGLLALL